MPPALANRHAGVSGQDDADVNHGADLRTIQTILSHADISTTELYTKVSQERIREVLARCHPRANPKHTQMSLFPRPSPFWYRAQSSAHSARHRRLRDIPTANCI